MGNLEAAADAYLAALDLDPLAISAAERLAELAPQLGDANLAAWVKVKTADLGAMATATHAPRHDQPRPYQQYEGVLGRG